MIVTDLSERYRTAWRTFVDETVHIRTDLRTAARDESTDLHALLTACEAIPYEEAHRFVQEGAEKSSNNIGPITGLFFESFAAALITGYLSSRVPDMRVQRNTCSDPSLRRIARDPDILVYCGARSVIFEIKASPKKRDIEAVRSYHQNYSTAAVPYYLIGGHVSLKPDQFQALAAERWACFANSSKRNRGRLEYLPSLDDIVRDAASFLGGS